MIRNMAVCAAALVVVVGYNAPAQAQVRVRAPFVEVDVNGGVRVRAPFVNLWIPSARVVVPAQPAAAPIPGDPVAVPAPPVVDPNAPAAARGSDELPAPRTVKGALTTKEFAAVFKAREGIHEVTMVNPFTKAPTNVRFTLPAGTPERVTVEEGRIEFIYGARQFVRIEFDDAGAFVTSR